MKLQIGKKKIDEIESLIETNCWKAMAWIHAVLHRQLKYLFYYGKERSKGDHEKKWKLVDKEICYKFDSARKICYIKNLINKTDSRELKAFNTFRNQKVGHPNIYEYLPEDEKVITACEKGFKLIKKLDNKLTKIFF